MKKILIALIIIFIGFTQALAADIEQELKTDDINKLLQTGTNYFYNNQNKEALRFADKAIKLAPENPAGYILKATVLQTTQAIRYINNDALKKFPKNEILYFTLSGHYLAEKNYKSAIDALNKSVEIMPHDSSYLVLAECYSKTGDYESAIYAYTMAIKLNPALEIAYINRAKLCGDNGEWKCALKDFERLKSLHPDNFMFYYMTSIYKASLGNFKDALTDINKAIKLSPKKQSFLYAEKAQIHLDRKEYTEAKLNLKEALDLDNTTPEANALLARMTYENKKYEAAIAAADKSIKYSTSKNPYVYSVKAKALYKLGKKNEAIAAINKSISIATKEDFYKKIKQKMLNNENVD